MTKKQDSVGALPRAEGNTLLGELLTTKMEDQGLSLKDVSIKADITYEHIRRIFKGEAIPSKFVLKIICEAMGVPMSEAERLATADKIRMKYGKIPLELAGKKPSLEPLDRIWDNLNERQQQDLIAMAQGWVKRNKLVGAAV